MKYLFWGFLSLLTACNTPNLGVCIDGPVPEKALVLKTISKAENNSRNAVVKVFSEREDGKGFGTGTVFKYRGETVVLTAAHVVGDLSYPATVSDGQSLVDTEIVYFDPASDLAVLRPKGPLNTRPMALRSIPQRQVKIGKDVFYSGYPNDASMLTLRGYIAGVHPSGYLYMHSYAWPGASGSAVMDEQGRIIGVLVAVDMAISPVGIPSVVEDVVIIVPIWKLDFDLLDTNL